MTINLTPDLERALARVAESQGTTPELLALDYLRERLLSEAGEGDENAETAAEGDFWAGYVGVLASGEHVPGGANLSEQTGARFAAGMRKRWEQGRL